MVAIYSRPLPKPGISELFLVPLRLSTIRCSCDLIQANSQIMANSLRFLAFTEVTDLFINVGIVRKELSTYRLCRDGFRVRVSWTDANFEKVLRL